MIASRTRHLSTLAAFVLLGGCGQADTDPGPGGVSVGEARALDQAAEMLDQQRLPAEALTEPGAAPGEADTEAAPDPVAAEE